MERKEKDYRSVKVRRDDDDLSDDDQRRFNTDRQKDRETLDETNSNGENAINMFHRQSINPPPDVNKDERRGVINFSFKLAPFHFMLSRNHELLDVTRSTAQILNYHPPEVNSIT